VQHAMEIGSMLGISCGDDGYNYWISSQPLIRNIVKRSRLLLPNVAQKAEGNSKTWSAPLILKAIAVAKGRGLCQYSEVLGCVVGGVGVSSCSLWWVSRVVFFDVVVVLGFCGSFFFPLSF
jgi:hypothetical protein